MAVWELIRDGVKSAHDRGKEWLTAGEIVREVVAANPQVNKGTINAMLRYHCINDPTKNAAPAPLYRKNPLLVTDDPTMHGKRYRLLTEEEGRAFLSNPREDLENVSYAQLMDWLQNPGTVLVPQEEGEVSPEEADAEAAFTGVALLELHLQDYLHRNWRVVFPELDIYRGTEGREFVTSEPSVGVIDFLCTDHEGNFVVVETKRNEPDRQAVGQLLGYMGWVQRKLCPAGKSVRGILIASGMTDRLQLAVAALPNVDVYLYEISFKLQPAPDLR
jgi:hypothetical protein